MFEVISSAGQGRNQSNVRSGTGSNVRSGTGSASAAPADVGQPDYDTTREGTGARRDGLSW